MSFKGSFQCNLFYRIALHKRATVMALLPFASEKWSLGALVCPVPLEGRARVSPEYIPVSPVEVTPQS